MIQEHRTISTDNTCVSCSGHQDSTACLAIPERNVLVAIINQAFEDATKTHKSVGERLAARKWIGEHGGMFDHVCVLLGIQPQLIRQFVCEVN